MVRPPAYRSKLLSLPPWPGLVTLCVALSWFWNWYTIEQQAMSIALERGRYTFKIIESTRLWVGHIPQQVAALIHWAPLPEDRPGRCPQTTRSPTGIQLFVYQCFLFENRVSTKNGRFLESMNR